MSVQSNSTKGNSIPRIMEITKQILQWVIYNTGRISDIMEEGGRGEQIRVALLKSTMYFLY